MSSKDEKDEKYEWIEDTIRVERENLQIRIKDIYHYSPHSPHSPHSTEERDNQILHHYEETISSLISRFVHTLSIDDMEGFEKTSEFLSYYFEQIPLFVKENTIVKIDSMNHKVLYHTHS
jgi:hypothetical protein